MSELVELIESLEVNHTTERFGTFESIRNDSKARILDAVRIEAGRWHLFTCEQLLQRQKRKSLLHRIVIGEKDTLR